MPKSTYWAKDSRASRTGRIGTCDTRSLPRKNRLQRAPSMTRARGGGSTMRRSPMLSLQNYSLLVRRHSLSLPPLRPTRPRRKDQANARIDQRLDLLTGNISQLQQWTSPSHHRLRITCGCRRAISSGSRNGMTSWKNGMLNWKANCKRQEKSWLGGSREIGRNQCDDRC
jgi:hypothetical protein